MEYEEAYQRLRANGVAPLQVSRLMMRIANCIIFRRDIPNEVSEALHQAGIDPLSIRLLPPPEADGPAVPADSVPTPPVRPAGSARALSEPTDAAERATAL